MALLKPNEHERRLLDELEKLMNERGRFVCYQHRGRPGPRYYPTHRDGTWEQLVLEALRANGGLRGT